MTLKHILLLLTLTLSLLCSMIARADNAEVISADVTTASHHTSIALLINQRLKYAFFTLDNPSRLVVDIENLALNDALKALKEEIATDNPSVKSIRVAKFNATTVRLVVDLQVGANATVNDLGPKQERQHRLVLDISNQQAPAKPAISLSDKPTQQKPPVDGIMIEKSAPEKNTSEKTSAETHKGGQNDSGKPDTDSNDLKPIIEPLPPELQSKEGQPEHQASNEVQAQVKKSTNTKSKERLITIAIDAGHGGEDPGARGANGSHEKDITLNIAKKLKQKLDEQDGLRAVLIRDGDYFVPLGERVKKARAAKADLFISIHADAFVNANARGSSVFALSQRGATSASARYLAQKENAVDLIGGVSLDTKDIDLAKTLLDLSQTATIHDGIRLGKSVLKKIGAINKLHSRHVEQAAFAVLKSPDIPSILVETAFISNPEEEAKLNDDDYQHKLVQAILGGVKAFIATNPAFARK